MARKCTARKSLLTSECCAAKWVSRFCNRRLEWACRNPRMHRNRLSRCLARRGRYVYGARQLERALHLFAAASERRHNADGAARRGGDAHFDGENPRRPVRGGPASARPAVSRDNLGSAAAHQAVGREAVRKSLVLLKNDNGLLPFNPRSHIAVVGEAANSMAQQTGGWTLVMAGR